MCLCISWFVSVQFTVCLTRTRETETSSSYIYNKLLVQFQVRIKLSVKGLKMFLKSDFLCSIAMPVAALVRQTVNERSSITCKGRGGVTGQPLFGVSCQYFAFRNRVPSEYAFQSSAKCHSVYFA